MNQSVRRQLITFGITLFAGLVFWIVAIASGEAFAHESAFSVFLIGLAPNLGTALVLPSFVVVYRVARRLSVVSDKFFYTTAVCTFAAMMLAEAAHDLIYSSPFDLYGVLWSALGFVVVIVLYLLTKERA